LIAFKEYDEPDFDPINAFECNHLFSTCIDLDGSVPCVVIDLEDTKKYKARTSIWSRLREQFNYIKNPIVVELSRSNRPKQYVVPVDQLSDKLASKEQLCAQWFDKMIAKLTDKRFSVCSIEGTWIPVRHKK